MRLQGIEQNLLPLPHMSKTLNSSGENQCWPPSPHPSFNSPHPQRTGRGADMDWRSMCSTRFHFWQQLQWKLPQWGREVGGIWRKRSEGEKKRYWWYLPKHYDLPVLSARTLIRSSAFVSFSFENGCFLSIVSLEALAESGDLGQARWEAINKSMHKGALFSSSVTVTAPFLGWKQSEQHQIGCDGIVDILLQS